MAEVLNCPICDADAEGSSIACDDCNTWYHRECLDMSINTFDNFVNDESFPWSCQNCDLQNTSNSSNTALDDTSNIPNNNKSHARTKTAERLTLAVFNFQGIMNKLTNLENFIHDHKIDILIGSETHLKEKNLTSEIVPDKYTAARKDRPEGKGGVIIIFKEELIIDEIKHETAEIVSLKVQTLDKPMIICACYRSMYNTDAQNNQLISEINQTCKKYKNNPIWIGGDFNLPDIDWSNNSITSYQYSKTLNESFLETFERGIMKQLVDFPTRLENTLDLLLTNRHGLLNTCTPIMGFGDHDTGILADTFCCPKRHKPVKKVINCWNRTDIEALKSDMKKNLTAACQKHTIDTPINDLWNDIKTVMLNTQKEHVPTKITSQRFSQPWFTHECRRAARMKKRRYRRYKSTKDPELCWW